MRRSTHRRVSSPDARSDLLRGEGGGPERNRASAAARGWGYRGIDAVDEVGALALESELHGDGGQAEEVRTLHLDVRRERLPPLGAAREDQRSMSWRTGNIAHEPNVSGAGAGGADRAPPIPGRPGWCMKTHT